MCEPIWHKIGKEVTVFCSTCKYRRQDCSFKDEDWMINAWPCFESTGAGAKKIQQSPNVQGVAGSSNINRSKGPAQFTFEPTAPPVGTSSLRGEDYSIFFRDVLPFQRILHDPGSSRAMLKLKAVELRSISIQEAGSILALRERVRGRDKIIRDIADQLSDAGADEEEDGKGDWESEHEKEHSGADIKNKEDKGK
jgi:hypothetical protein